MQQIIISVILFIQTINLMSERDLKGISLINILKKKNKKKVAKKDQGQLKDFLKKSAEVKILKKIGKLNKINNIDDLLNIFYY